LFRLCFQCQPSAFASEYKGVPGWEVLLLLVTGGGRDGTDAAADGAQPAARAKDPSLLVCFRL